MNFLGIQNIGSIMLVLILGLLILIIYRLLTDDNMCDYNEGMINISKIDTPAWNRNSCNYYMSQTLKDVFDEKNIKNSEEWNVYLPCGYDDIEKEIKKMPVRKNARYFIIHDADNITAKELLWKNILSHHGYQKAITMMPVTYILYKDEDVERLKRDFIVKPYIMKKNIQRQEGLKITNDLNTILQGRKEGYVIVQELLQNPYIIEGRKTNMRFYVLVVCKNSDMDVYVYNDGFMYYTKDMFKKGSLEDGPNITTGYIDRSVYDENPLTHKDYRDYLDKYRELSIIEENIRKQNLKVSDIVFNRIYRLLSEVFTAYIGRICNGDKLRNNISFQLFGVDIAVADDLYPMIIEVNKGPDMGAKDKRDSELKHNVMRDMLKIIGVNDTNGSNGFIRIVEFENKKLKTDFYESE